MIDPKLNLLPTPEDDVESFFLVLVYAVVRSLAWSDRMLRIKRADGLHLDVVRSRKEQLLKFIAEHWGAATVEEIYRSRACGSFLETLLSDGPAGFGSVGEWFLTGGQILVSDALLDAVLEECLPKFSNLAYMKRPRNRLGPRDPTIVEKPFWTYGQLLTHEELIKMLKGAIAGMEDGLEVEYIQEQEVVV